MTGFDPGAPSPARVHNFIGGGRNHGPEDRAAGLALEAICPQVRRIARDNLLFRARAAGYIAGHDVTQFIDLGSGMPAGKPLHEAVQSVRPDAAVCYVDLDKEVTWTLAGLYPEGERNGVGVACADYQDPDMVLSDPGLRAIVDPAKPVALFATLVLHFMAPGKARRLVAGYVKALAPGSFVALTVPRFGDAGMLADLRNALSPAVPFDFSTTDVGGLFGALEVVPPGIGAVRWLNPGWAGLPGAEPKKPHCTGGIARRP